MAGSLYSGLFPNYGIARRFGGSYDFDSSLACGDFPVPSSVVFIPRNLLDACSFKSIV